MRPVGANPLAAAFTLHRPTEAAQEAAEGPADKARRVAAPSSCSTSLEPLRSDRRHRT